MQKAGFLMTRLNLFKLPQQFITHRSKVVVLLGFSLLLVINVCLELYAPYVPADNVYIGSTFLERAFFARLTVCSPCDLSSCNFNYFPLEPRYEKTGFLHMRKQRRRSAAQLLRS